MTALYKDGTVTLVQGSADIVGNDTGWKVALIVGGTVFVEAEGGAPLPILPDDSDGANLHPITNTKMTAAIKWTGASGTYNYAIVRDMSYSRQQSANADALALYLQRLNNPSLAAVSGLVPAEDSLILFTGPDTATVIQRSSLVQGVDYDADADDIAGRNLFSSEAKGFSVLVANAGEGRTAIFIKRSSTDGDWSVPFYLSGPVGPKGDTGATGITDAGVYSTISAYAIRDAVLDNGSTWLAKSAVPAGNPPPVLPATQNDYWRLLARRGIDGTGIGDVVGPTGGVSVNDLAVFADTTGKLLKKAPNNVVSNALLSQLSAPAIKGRLTIGSGDVEDLTPAQARQLLGGWEYITTIGVGSGSVVAITNLSAFYSIRITQRTILTTGGYLGIQVSTDNGATFLTSTTDYRYNIVDNYFNGSTSTVSGGDGGIAQMPIGDENSSGIITMSAFNAPLVAYSVGQSISDVGSNRVLRNIGHKITGTTPRNALRIIAPVGTFLHGVFVVEGVRL